MRTYDECVNDFCRGAYDYLRNHPGEVITIHKYFQPADTLGEIVRGLKGWGVCILRLTEDKIVVCL